MMPDDISDEFLLQIVGTTDKELFEKGLDIGQRYWHVPRAVMKKFGYAEYVLGGPMKPKILERIEASFASIYRPQDLAVGGHIGIFMYRDIFARIQIPRAVGVVRINPLRFVELTPVQIRIIRIEPKEIASYVDQFWDVADIQYGVSEIKAPYCHIELVERFVGLARLHLHAASAVLTGGYDFRGAVQAALLASELALKAGVATRGFPEREIKSKFAHNSDIIADFVGSIWPAFDVGRVKRVIAKQPLYVPNRYSASQPDRREVGHLVMGAQYVVAEVVRQISNRNFRSGFDPPIARHYPV